MTTQPEALRLADKMSNTGWSIGCAWDCHQASVELRRLHESNLELLEALHAMLTYTADLNPAQGFDDDDHNVVKQACAAINKAERTTP